MPVPDPSTIEIANQTGTPGDLGDFFEAVPSSGTQPAPSSAGAAAPAPPTPITPAEPPRGPDGRFVPKPPHPDYLVRDAIELGLGFDPADFAEISTSTLSRQVHTLRLQREQDLRAQLEERRRDRQTVAQPHPDDVRPPAPPAQNPDDFGLTEEERADLHPGLLKILQAQAREIKALRGVVGEVKQSDQARQQSEQDRLIDGAFAALGPRYERVYGKGRMSDLTDQGARARRLATWQQSQQFKGSIDAKIAQTARLLYPMREAPAEAPSAYGAAATAGTPPANGAPRAPYTQEEWDRAALERPNGASPEEETGDRRAVRNLARRIGVPDPGVPDFVDMPGIPE